MKNYLVTCQGYKKATKQRDLLFSQHTQSVCHATVILIKSLICENMCLIFFLILFLMIKGNELEKRMKGLGKYRKFSKNTFWMIKFTYVKEIIIRDVITFFFLLKNSS